MTMLNILTVDHFGKQLRLEGCLGFTWPSYHPPRKCGWVRDIAVIPAGLGVCQHTSHHSNMPTGVTMMFWTSPPFRQPMGCGELCCPTSSITLARKGEFSGVVLVFLRMRNLPPPLGVNCVWPDEPDRPWCTPEPILLDCASALRKLDKFWTEGC